MKKKLLSVMIGVFVITGFVLVFLPSKAEAKQRAECQFAVANNIFQGGDGTEDGIQNISNCSADSLVYGLFATLMVEPTLQVDANKYQFKYSTVNEDPDFVAVYGETKHISQIAGDSVVAFYDNPLQIDSMEYLANEWSPKGVMAASGTDLLSPVEGASSFMRNLAYGILATIIVVIGIMIMFRQKVGGQMIVTVQNSIPRILISILLITISFPLVALMVDISMILMGYVGHLFEEVDGIGNFVALGFSMFGTFVTGTLPVETAVEGGFYLAVAPLVGTLVGTPATGGIIVVVEAIIILMLIAVFLWLAFRIWTMLLTTYAKIFLDVVILPINILMGTIPGNDKMVIDALKRVFINIMVIPVTYFLLSLAYDVAHAGAIPWPGDLFTEGAAEGEYGQELFNLIAFNGLIFYGIVIMLPAVPDILEGMFEVDNRIFAAAQEKGRKMVGKVPIFGGIMGSK